MPVNTFAFVTSSILFYFIGSFFSQSNILIKSSIPPEEILQVICPLVPDSNLLAFTPINHYMFWCIRFLIWYICIGWRGSSLFVNKCLCVVCKCRIWSLASTTFSLFFFSFLYSGCHDSMCCVVCCFDSCSVTTVICFWLFYCMLIESLWMKFSCLKRSCLGSYFALLSAFSFSSTPLWLGIQHIIASYCGGLRSVMVIVVENGHGDTSSNSGRDWLHFT